MAHTSMLRHQASSVVHRISSLNTPGRVAAAQTSFNASRSAYRSSPAHTRSIHSSRPIAMPQQPNGHATSNGNSSKRQPALTLETINPAVLDVQYAVRGELALRAEDYMQKLNNSAEGSSGSGKAAGLPFDKVVTANIGNPQQKGLDQVPITYWRQVISLLEYPNLMEEHLEIAKQIYPEDVIARAKSLRAEIGSTGAYTHSKGILGIRKRVAKFIEERDGYPADPEAIYLTAGASGGVSSLMGIALTPSDGCMIPIPQYPLYTATLAYIGAHPVPYYLSEPDGWSMNHQILVDGIEKAKKDGKKVKALVIINPGNPTGSCLSQDAIEAVIKLCHDESILLMADEVYQNNIFSPDTKPFVSFKKVLRSMPAPIRDEVELVSFHSISKGVSGECGRRGGYFEVCNVREDVLEQIYKMASVSLCPPVTGQIGVDLLVSPPKEGEPSYELYKTETSTTAEHLHSRSQIMYERFNALPGMSCQPAEGAMYLFPRIDMPEKAVAKAKELGKPADTMYALDLLDATGICAVAGSGFGQEPGTYHLRVTALCPGVEDYIGKIEKFHKEFMEKYA